MSDIDFEELDKAINKASGTDSEQKPAEETEDKSENFADNQETSEKSVNIEENQTNEEDESDKKIVPHREGRFLDMIHPSADMSSSPSSFSPSQSITKIDPLDDESSNEDEEKPVGADEDTELSETNADSESYLNDDSVEKNDEKSDEEPDEKPIEQSPPVESPFIEGSEKKVSKRPLGGWNQDGHQAEKTASEDDSSTDLDDNNTKESEEIILPPELEKELVEIEETNELRSTKSEIDDSLSKELDDELASHDDNSESKPSSSPEPISGLLESGKDADEQYKVGSIKEESSKETLHPLFADGHSNHIAASKKPSSHGVKILRWAVTIIGLIMLGVIIGASVFFFATGGSGL